MMGRIGAIYAMGWVEAKTSDMSPAKQTVSPHLDVRSNTQP